MQNVAEAALGELIPHRGAMLLLDRVVDWSDERIVCEASSHRRVEHPLRVEGVLPAVAAIEYAAQAMAAHGGLLARKAGTRAMPGYLAAVREVELGAASLDSIGAPLVIEATRLAADARSLMYAFRVSADGRDVAAGRAVVMLNEMIK
jgi:predicted hotdog family 3-hydroxylacyl-ACP dehydratase